MGGCLSLSLRSSGSAGAAKSYDWTAKVISLNGSLREYAAPVGVDHVLGAEIHRNKSSSFVCNSDSLYFDEAIPPLNPKDELRPNHIYFVLSASKREKTLSPSDMAALALKATQAMQSSSSKNDKNDQKKSRRISPVIIDEEEEEEEEEKYQHPLDYHHELTVGVGVASPKISKQKFISKASLNLPRIRMPPFKLRLSTIYESS